MTRLAKGFSLALSLIAVAVIATGCTSPATPTTKPAFAAPTNGWVQSNSGGGVTLEVEWEGEENGTLVFDVAMDTHSVDLDRYDLGELATLRDDKGYEYPPTSWLSSSGGHHRTGTLFFRLPDSLSQGKAKYLEMVVREVAGIKERVLRWELR